MTILDYHAHVASVPILGEVVCWSIGRHTVGYIAVKAALASAGLPTDIVRDMLPRNAFSRAARQMQRDRIITKVHENDTQLFFQFNIIEKHGERVDLPYEATLCLNKTTGSVTCDQSDELRRLAELEIDKAMRNRTSADITRIVQKLFEDRAGLWPIRDQGGAYFVPIEHQGFVEQVEEFLTAMAGNMKRLPIAKGTVQGDKSVRETLTAGMQAIIEEHQDAVEDFDDDTKGATMERRAEKIQKTRFQIEAYAEYLDSEKERLLESLEAAKEKLMEKILVMA